MQQLISDCRFMLDYVKITILSSKPHLLVRNLSKYMSIGRSAMESRCKHPEMPDKFETRTYLRFGKLKKFYLIHKKIAPLQGIDALLVIHDVPFFELLQIESVLKKVSAVDDFHFSYIEFTWDLFPGSRHTAFALQQKIVKHLHLSYARKAWYEPRPEKLSFAPPYNRYTFYINERGSDIQGKVYIRPKVPDTTKIEFVRLELIGTTRWLKRINLFKPSDFSNLSFDKLTQQLLWLDLNLDRVKRDEMNVLTGGFWFRKIHKEQKYLGIAYIITEHREDRVCPSRCSAKGYLKKCLLAKAHNRGAIREELVEAVQKCGSAKVQRHFTKEFCQPYKHEEQIRKIMLNAYEDWRKNLMSTKDVTVKNKKRRQRKKLTNAQKVELYQIFNNPNENEVN